jgi:DNA-binding response OmpR family regulator
MAKIKTVLFAEDDQVLLTLYRKHLQQAGYHVIPAQDGLEAMRNLSIFVPDLVVLDLMMPKFNGEEVLEYVCKHARLAIVPLIILSSNTVVDVGHEHLLERADKCLLKHHCTPTILLQAIQELFSTQLEDNEDEVRPTGSFENSIPNTLTSAIS